MERRWYFLAGDVLSTATIGAVTALALRATVGDDWSLAPAMLAGMALGMILATVLIGVFMPFFGAFEVMLPGMLSGMLAGMTAAMLASLRPLPPSRAAAWGALAGITILLVTYALNARLRARE